MNKIQIFSICTLLFTFFFINTAYAVNEIDTESVIIIPDITIDFNDDKNWYGLKSGQTPYWKIEDGVGKFSLTSGTLSPGERQLESASLDRQS